jgi:DNA polymerase-3 subunit epsilon
VAACGLQADLDALASVYCPAGRRHFHAALYDALAGALLLASLSRQPQLASLTTMQLLALSTLDPRKRDAIVQRDLF